MQMAIFILTPCLGKPKPITGPKNGKGHIGRCTPPSLGHGCCRWTQALGIPCRRSQHRNNPCCRGCNGTPSHQGRLLVLGRPATLLLLEPSCWTPH